MGDKNDGGIGSPELRAVALQRIFHSDPLPAGSFPWSGGRQESDRFFRSGHGPGRIAQLVESHGQALEGIGILPLRPFGGGAAIYDRPCRAAEFAHVCFGQPAAGAKDVAKRGVWEIRQAGQNPDSFSRPLMGLLRLPERG